MGELLFGAALAALLAELGEVFFQRWGEFWHGRKVGDSPRSCKLKAVLILNKYFTTQALTKPF